MLLDLIKNRKSVREYQEKHIPQDILDKILLAGYYAPSWMNSQPWKFILVQNEETKKILCELSSNQPHVKSADALIVCVASKNAWSKEEFGEVLKQRGMNDAGVEKIFSIPMFYPPLLGENIKLLRTVEQVTYAVSYMMLTAEDLGVSSCIIGAISNEATVLNNEMVKKANNALNLSKDDVIIIIITLGYEKNSTETKKLRKDFNKVVFKEKVGSI